MEEFMPIAATVAVIWGAFKFANWVSRDEDEEPIRRRRRRPTRRPIPRRPIYRDYEEDYEEEDFD